MLDSINVRCERSLNTLQLLNVSYFRRAPKKTAILQVVSYQTMVGLDLFQVGVSNLKNTSRGQQES